VARVKWELTPDAQDYPAAASYLSLLVEDAALRDELVARLRRAPIVHFKAKDLLRASQLPLLPENNPHVAEDLQKVRKRRALSPILIVRGDLVRGFPLQVADGYHRVCASYHVMENTDIPCRLIDLPVERPDASPAATPAATPAADLEAPAGTPPEGPVAAKTAKTARKAPARAAAKAPAVSGQGARKAAPAKRAPARKAAAGPLAAPPAAAAPDTEVAPVASVAAERDAAE
jgi:hypothetical protein